MFHLVIGEYHAAGLPRERRRERRAVIAAELAWAFQFCRLFKQHGARGLIARSRCFGCRAPYARYTVVADCGRSDPPPTRWECEECR